MLFCCTTHHILYDHLSLSLYCMSRQTQHHKWLGWIWVYLSHWPVSHSLDGLSGALVVVLFHVAVHGAQLNLTPEVNVHRALLHRGVDELVWWISQLQENSTSESVLNQCYIPNLMIMETNNQMWAFFNSVVECVVLQVNNLRRYKCVLKRMQWSPRIQLVQHHWKQAICSTNIQYQDWFVLL